MNNSFIPDKLTTLRQSLLKLRINAITRAPNLSVEPLNTEILSILRQLSLLHEQNEYLLAEIPENTSDREAMKQWFEECVTLIASLRKKWREVSEKVESPGGSARKRRLSTSASDVSSQHQQHMQQRRLSSFSSSHSYVQDSASNNSRRSQSPSPEKSYHSLVKVGQTIVNSPRLDKVVDSLTRMQLNISENDEPNEHVPYENSEYTQPLQRHTSTQSLQHSTSSSHSHHSTTHEAQRSHNLTQPQHHQPLDEYRIQILNETTNLLQLRFRRDSLTEQLLQKQPDPHDYYNFISVKQAEYMPELEQITHSAQQLFAEVRHLEQQLAAPLAQSIPLSPQQQEQLEHADMQQMYSNLSNSLGKQNAQASSQHDDVHSTHSTRSASSTLSSYHSEANVYMTNDGSGFAQNSSPHSSRSSDAQKVDSQTPHRPPTTVSPQTKTPTTPSMNLEEMTHEERLEYFRRQEFDLLLKRMNSDGIEAPLPVISPSAALPPHLTNNSVFSAATPSGNGSPMDRVMALEAQWQEQKSQLGETSRLRSSRRESIRFAASARRAPAKMQAQQPPQHIPVESSSVASHSHSSPMMSPASHADDNDSSSTHASYNEVDNIYDYQAEFRGTEEVMTVRHPNQDSDLPSPVQPTMHRGVHRVYEHDEQQEELFEEEEDEELTEYPSEDSPPQRKRKPATNTLYGVTNNNAAPPKQSTTSTKPSTRKSLSQPKVKPPKSTSITKRSTTAAPSRSKSRGRESLSSARTSTTSSFSRNSTSPNQSTKRKSLMDPEEGRRLAQKRAAKLLREKKKQEELKKIEELTKKEKMLEVQEKARKRAEMAARMADEKKAMLDIMEDLSDEEEEQEVDQLIEQDQEDVAEREEKVREAQRKAKQRARLAKKKLEDVRMQKEIEKAKRDEEKWKKRDEHLREWAEERKKRDEMKRKWEQQQLQNKKQQMMIEEEQKKSGNAMTPPIDATRDTADTQSAQTPPAAIPTMDSIHHDTPVKQSIQNRPVPTIHPAPQPPPRQHQTEVRQPQRRQNGGVKKATAKRDSASTPPQVAAEMGTAKPRKDPSRKAKASPKEQVQVYYKPTNGASANVDARPQESSSAPRKNDTTPPPQPNSGRILKSPIITTKTPPHYKKLLEESSDDSIAFSPFPQQEAGGTRLDTKGGPINKINGKKPAQSAHRITHEIQRSAHGHLSSLDSPLNDPSINYYDNADDSDDVSSVGDALDLDMTLGEDLLVSEVVSKPKARPAANGNRFGWKG